MYQLCLQNFSMEPQLCNKVIQSVLSDSNLPMWMYEVKKCNFYVSSSVNNYLKTCSYVGFCSIFWLQVLLKNFLWVKTIPTGYLKGPPGSGLYIGNKIMVTQLTNPFLFMKTFIPPPKCRIWKSLLYVLCWSFEMLHNS